MREGGRVGYCVLGRFCAAAGVDGWMGGGVEGWRGGWIEGWKDRLEGCE